MLKLNNVKNKTNLLILLTPPNICALGTMSRSQKRSRKRSHSRSLSRDKARSRKRSHSHKKKVKKSRSKSRQRSRTRSKDRKKSRTLKKKSKKSKKKKKARSKEREKKSESTKRRSQSSSSSASLISDTSLLSVSPTPSKISPVTSPKPNAKINFLQSADALGTSSSQLPAPETHQVCAFFRIAISQAHYRLCIF